MGGGGGDTGTDLLVTGIKQVPTLIAMEHLVTGEPTQPVHQNNVVGKVCNVLSELSKTAYGLSELSKTEADSIKALPRIDFSSRCAMKSYGLSELSKTKADSIKALPRIDFSSIFSKVQPIVDHVGNRGDAAVSELVLLPTVAVVYTMRFDKVSLDKIIERVAALPNPQLDPAVKHLMLLTITHAFHDAPPVKVENVKRRCCCHRVVIPQGLTKYPWIKSLNELLIFLIPSLIQLLKRRLMLPMIKGIRCKRVSWCITSVGLYVPGGTAVLPSTALMLAVPAQITGCKIVVLATPPGKDGSICKEMLYCIKKAGVTNILKAREAHIVEKNFGLGNQHLTAAKKGSPEKQSHGFNRHACRPIWISGYC
ncbi:hypothetical protein MKW98_016786 [Papaver atlanticum]|uniref:Uncharacterized protein n=1 Tax=Papaver atlanticum TaxID=357466 RepID=A0AAD4TJA0_9MAGN|nr:hypothetical protein MKW98_016786 [Papaver atlanticum]